MLFNDDQNYGLDQFPTFNYQSLGIIDEICDNTNYISDHAN